MNVDPRVRYLRVALVAVGLIFLVGLYPLMNAWWPSGWRWQPNQPEYEQMILGVYATLGMFLLIASRNPLRHRSLIWFTVWSSLVHAAIMTAQAISMPMEHGHLIGDIPGLVAVAALLAVLTPSGAQEKTARDTALTAATVKP